jgi:hypothetical protein
MGKSRQRLRWENVERVVTLLVGIAGQVARLIDTFRRIC